MPSKKNILRGGLTGESIFIMLITVIKIKARVMKKHNVEIVVIPDIEEL